MEISWRLATKEDRPALEAIQARMNECLGADYPLPDLCAKSIMFAMLGERNGEIIGVWYIEAVMELKFCSTDPKFTVLARRDHWERVCQETAAGGFRFIQVPVPKEASEAIGETLTDKRMGMRESSDTFFVKDLEALCS